MDYAKVTSGNIKKLMVKNHMSIRQLAEVIGVSASTLTDSLKSKKGVPIGSLMAIAECFGVTVNLLCDPEFDPSGSALYLQDPDSFAKKYRELDAHGRELVDFIFVKELERMNSK